ncbi:MAG: hypothetical protein ACE366_15190 [Bradymonadia bacterium]
MLGLLFLLGALSLSVGSAVAQEGAPPSVAPHNAMAPNAAPPEGVYHPAVTSSGGRVLFWIGGFAVMIFAGWFIFREQVGERQTIRLLVDKVGPFFREFDPANVHRWIELAGPHVWQGWKQRDMSSLQNYVTEGFTASMAEHFEELERRGLAHKGEFVKVLKVHPLSLHPVGPGPAPADLELVCRVEVKGDDWLVDGDDKVVAGRPERGQVMHFWTLRHNGHRWYLHHIERAERDRTDLGKMPPLPPIMEWRRPDQASEAGAEGSGDTSLTTS